MSTGNRAAEGVRRFIHFVTAAEFRAWLEENHATKTELTVRLHKKAAGRKSISYEEALDEALCFGWIDGVRHSLDAESYTIRFTPRRPRSIWSLGNVRHVKRLQKLGKMADPGFRVFASREARRTGIYSFEQQRPGLSARYKKIFQTKTKAWKFFSSQPPWYQRTAGFWVSSAKRPETRERRLQRLMKDSANGQWLPQLTPKAKRRLDKRN